MAEILIVDDEALNREVLREFLESKGHVVLEAADGMEACLVAATCAPALILMDIRMPQVDGYAALAQLRGTPGTATIPVVAVTAFAMSSDRQKVADAGFDGYVTKPIDFAALGETIREVMK